MAARVEATSREMSQSLNNPDKSSVSASALPGDTGKPALGPKPHLMPKPFARQRNATVRSIRAPNLNRQLNRASSSETLFNNSKSGVGSTKPLESLKSGSNGTVNGPNQSAAPKPVPLSPKPDLIAKPKPEPTKSPGSDNQTGPKPGVTDEDVKGVHLRSRAKSFGSLDQKILNQEDQEEAAKTKANVKAPSRCWPPRNRLSVELTSKFESPSQPEKEVKRDAEISKLEKERPPQSPSESKFSKLPVEKGETGDEELSGGSIRRRISLLFDQSAAAQRRDTFNKKDNPPAEISVDIKQRIKNLSLDAPKIRLPSTGAPKSPPSEKTQSTSDEPQSDRSSEKPAEREKVPFDKPPNATEIKNVEKEKDDEDEDEDENFVPVPVYRRVGMSLDAETKRREEEEKQRKDEQLEKERQQRERKRLLEEERKAREMERQKEEEQKRAEEERKQEEEKQRQMEERRKQEEERKRRIEEERKEEERRRQIEEEMRRIEEEKERRREEERQKKEREMEEERKRIQELERQKEEERLRKQRELEILRKEIELEEERQRTQEMERQREEERLRQERERLKKEKEMEEERQRIQEMERQKEEERLRKERELERIRKEKEMEEERQRIEEMERQKEEERLRQEREKERLRKEKEMEEEKRRIQELERQKEEERLRKEREIERIRKEKEMEERKRMEEERQREEERLRQERERLKKEKEMEEERRRIQELERQKEEERLRKEQELERLRKEKEMEEERRRIQELERQKEEERLRKEREIERLRKEKEMEEERRRIQEMERQKEEERLRQEREMERKRKEKEMEERKRMEEERQREEERLRQERERLKKEKELEEERRRIQELERLKEEERLRKEQELERIRKEREMEEARRRIQEMERQKEEERLRQEREMDRIRKEKQKEEERQREEERLRQEREKERLRKEIEMERLKEEQLRQERGKDMETYKEVERLQQEVPTSYDLISFDAEEPAASQTRVSAVQAANVSPRLTEVIYDDFSVKPRRWGTGARRSPSPSREPPAAPDYSLQPESKSSHPGYQEPCKDQGNVQDLIGFEASSPQNYTESRKQTYLFEEETEDLSKPVDLLEPETDEGQLKDGEPEEDRVAEQDTENPFGETDDQSENNDTVDGDATQIKINQALQRLTQVRRRNTSSDSDTADVSAQEEPELLPVLESAAPLLDSSVFRSKVDLGKKRSIKRSRPSRAVRQRGALPALTEGTQPDWTFCDSTEPKDQCSNGADSESEEEPSRDVTSSIAPTQPKRVSVFPGMDPSALMAQLKRRSGVVETESPTEAQTPPSVPARSPRTPNRTLGPRVLPPVDAKDSGSGSSPSWLLELKSKKRMSQPESEA